MYLIKYQSKITMHTRPPHLSEERSRAGNRLKVILEFKLFFCIYLL